MSWNWLVVFPLISNWVPVGMRAIVSNDYEQRLELAVGRHSWCFLESRLSGQGTRTVVLEPSLGRNSRSAG